MFAYGVDKTEKFGKIDLEDITVAAVVFVYRSSSTPGCGTEFPRVPWSNSRLHCPVEAAV